MLGILLILFLKLGYSTKMDHQFIIVISLSLFTIMPHQSLIDSIEKVLTLTADEKVLLKGSFQTATAKKKDILLKEAEITKYSYFVEDGLLRMYATDNNGFDHNIQFAMNGWWMSDMLSLLNQTPASFNIEAIEDSRLLTISQPAKETLLQSIPGLNIYFRKLSENALAAYQQRFAINLSLPAQERYGKFCERYPMLIQRLPQKHIASYIGVTPEFLSKMLNRPFNQK